MLIQLNKENFIVYVAVSLNINSRVVKVFSNLDLCKSRKWAYGRHSILYIYMYRYMHTCPLCIILYTLCMYSISCTCACTFLMYMNEYKVFVFFAHLFVQLSSSQVTQQFLCPCSSTDYSQSSVQNEPSSCNYNGEILN